MPIPESCVIWDRAKSLGKQRGLDVENEMRMCSVMNLCQGEECIYVSPTPDTGPQQVEKFLTRQEKTEELQLAEVRREIARLTQSTHL